MSTFALRASDTAGRMAEHFGAPLILRKVTAAGYDDATRRNANTTVDYSLGYGRLQAQVITDEVGNLVQTDKKEIVIPADQLPSGVVPNKDYLLLLGGQQYTILDLAPEGAGIPYEYKATVMGTAPS